MASQLGLVACVLGVASLPWVVACVLVVASPPEACALVVVSWTEGAWGSQPEMGW